MARLYARCHGVFSSQLTTISQHQQNVTHCMSLKPQTQQLNQLWTQLRTIWLLLLVLQRLEIYCAEIPIDWLMNELEEVECRESNGTGVPGTLTGKRVATVTETSSLLTSALFLTVCYNFQLGVRNVRLRLPLRQSQQPNTSRMIQALERDLALV